MDITTNLLQEARAKVAFAIDDVTNLLYGSKEEYEKLRDFHNKCTDIKGLQINADFYNQPRKRQFINKGNDFPHFNSLMRHKPDDMDKFMAPILYSATTNYWGVFFGMVVPAIKILGTDEQIKAWYQRCVSLDIMACYAQTEIAHGSDVQNLLTTATYDHQTDEFIIDTPSIEATKFWPGDLGLLANWALVFAQLVIDNKKLGVHAFMVPIRDQNHKPLPGVEVGDIGPKLGYQTKDNGYLILHKVRIPRFNMLARYTSVSREGKIQTQGNPKVQYSSMMIMRKLIITTYARSSSISLVIAIRYSIARTQFRNDDGVENSVLEYQTQQDKLLPLLANQYAVIFTGIVVGRLVDQNFEQVQKNDFTLMDVCHALLSGTKANFTHFVVNCAEWCRLSCGGHGYAHYSGLPGIYQENAPNVTLEGENQIMYLQLARYLLKMVKLATKSPNKIPEQFSVFREMEILEYKCTSFNEGEILKLLESQAIHQIVQTAQKMMQFISEGIDAKDVWDYKIGTDLLQSSVNFIEYFKYVSFQKTVQGHPILNKLANLFGIQILLESSVLIEKDVITKDVAKSMKEYKESILPIIKEQVLLSQNQSIGLVDAFKYKDEVLKSTIGCYDGKPYERTYEFATQHNLMNKIDAPRILNQLKNVQLKSKL